MKNETQKKIFDLDEFDETISLWQLMPSGTGKAGKFLKFIVDSVLNNDPSLRTKPVSLLITGYQAKRSHGRCFLRALGIEEIQEIPSNLLQTTTAVRNFFDRPGLGKGYLISNAQMLSNAVQINLLNILTKGEFYLNTDTLKNTETFAVPSSLVLTAPDKKSVPICLAQKVEYSIEIEPYTDTQLELIVLQRLKYCGVDYQDEELLKYIVIAGMKNLYCTITLIKLAITIMLSDCRTTLMMSDVKRALLYL
jgi:hypothetical protein